MENPKTDLFLDVDAPSFQGEVRVRRGDSVRVIRAVLTMGSSPLPLSEGTTVRFYEKKADGSVVYNSCTVSDDSIVCPLTGGATDTPGVAECEFRVIDAFTGELLTSPRFTLFVEDSVYNDGAVEAAAGEGLGVLDELIGDSEAWAVGKRNGADVTDADPAYRNNSKHYAGLSKEERLSAMYYSDRAAADAARAEAGVPRLYGTETLVPSVILTEEQYQALADGGAVDPGTLYLIYGEEENNE